DYRQWLLQITICDPACGSGAFLNAALQFLIQEHRLIDEMDAKITDSPMVIPNVENSILENNLFGVDINEESVEIARLSLWLRTARPHRKLNSLNQNIKCGNSLISDPEVAADKAFDWQREFPQVFERGGFDVVIGNPPYVSAITQIANPEMAAQRQAIVDSDKFQTLFQKWDLYIPFIELGIKYLCKNNGYCSMIVPYPLSNQLYAQKCRQMLINEYNLTGFVDCSDTKVFEDAVVQSCIFIARKQKPQGNVDISKIENAEIQFSYAQNYSDLIQDEKNFVWNMAQQKRETARHNDMHVLGDYCYISIGMVLNADEKTAKGEFTKDELISELEDNIHCKQYVEAKNIESYLITKILYLEYGTERVPAKIRRPTFPELYDRPKILTNKIGALKATIDFNGIMCDQTNRICILWKDLHGVENKSIASSVKKYSKMTREEMESLSGIIDLRYILGILNSKYANVLLDTIRGKGNIDVNPEYIRNIPIPQQTDNKLVENVDKMLTLNADLQQKVSRFLRRITETYNLEKTTATLETFYTLSFSDFVKELGKQKVKLTLVQKDELEDYFNAYQAECQSLKNAIATTDHEIDRMVYALYGLTDEEIGVVEN
ncbi:MAG: N-6 DNA methylase, partial [Salinivirgaceae bacterium]|nr:N-6 DNA methylase [Salinivirgaceae bacterium]